MTTVTVNAGANAALANDIVQQATAEPASSGATVVSPSDTLVNLPGGFLAAGEVIRTAEVRELTGRDEEAIARSAGTPRLFSSILSRAVVSIGGTPASEEMLDSLLAGDRDALLLGIYRVTFGSIAEVQAWCNGCREAKTVGIDTHTDIKTKVLVDSVEDRTFTVKGKKSEYLVTLPTGITSKLLAADTERNYAESVTVLLEQTVLQIDGRPVLGKFQIQNLGIVDRNKIASALAERNPGPQFDDVSVTCPDCESEVLVPINLGTLFQF
jgi:hypothetical protein